MILFCLPYAGGSGAIYYKWKNYLHPSIQLVPIELKGRGKRIREVFYQSLEEAVEDIFENIKEKITNNDYAIYGHSMGSLLAYELYYKIDKMNMKKPKHIFFSGDRPPSIKTEDEEIYTLSDYELIKKVMGLGGTPEDLMNNQSLLKIIAPIIRNDFKIFHEYKYQERKNKISCNASILYGSQDSISLEDIQEWRNHVEKEFKIYRFHGNHFFINTETEEIGNVINKTLFYKSKINFG